MSPERIMDDDFDSSADIWSIGLILIELLTGSRPAGLYETLKKKERVQVPKSCPQEFQDIIRRMTDPNRETRCTFEEFREFAQKYCQVS
jgi:serine/threonine protein kinase